MDVFIVTTVIHGIVTRLGTGVSVISREDVLRPGEKHVNSATIPP